MTSPTEMYGTIEAVAAFATVISLMLGIYVIQLRKMTMKEIYKEATTTPYFRPTKKLGIKDEVILSMLEGCQEKGPCYVITDPDLNDNPIIYASHGFSQQFGYPKKEIEGRNCRFLQGPGTKKEDIARIRGAIDKKLECSVCVLNYKKNGETFMNQFFLTPLWTEDGKVAYYLGVQAEVLTLQPYPKKEENPGFKMYKYFDSK